MLGKPQPAELRALPPGYSLSGPKSHCVYISVSHDVPGDGLLALSLLAVTCMNLGDPFYLGPSTSEVSQTSANLIRVKVLPLTHLQALQPCKILDSEDCKSPYYL